jgi:hypothetical protein
LVVVFVVALVLSPVVRGRDSFPLSTYPMYAETRGRTVTVSTAVRRDGRGTVHRLSLGAIAGTDDPLLAESAIANAIAHGQADELCAEIAGRLSPDVRGDAVEIVEERHDAVAAAAGEESVLHRRLVARCSVRG